ncbi:MAG TPA: LuxR C-terminal-related transcriptional regulator [Mycobacteriales bacterium]|nr:LuxR C-terminal-related transcriptional regulator [Mycobacteriales bacterium]
MAGVVERGRAAFERQAWAEAYELLTAAVQQGPVDAEDHERLAVASYLLGKDEESNKAWERAHHRCLSSGAPDRAARCAFWLGLSLLLRGEGAPASGWLARATRLVTEGGLDCVARGFLLVPEALVLLGSNPAGAAALAVEAREIGERFADDDLRAFAWLMAGQAAVALGEHARGLACLDEAMVAVTAGEVSPIPAGIVYCAVIEECMTVYDLRRAAEWTQALSSWCDAQPDLVPYRGQCLVHRSQILMAQGAWPAASAAAERACQWLARPAHPALGIALYQQAELLRLCGDFDAAANGYRKASQFGIEPLPGLALLRLTTGQLDAATTAIRRAVEDAGHAAGRPTLLAAYVEIMLAADDVRAGRAASDELSQLADSLDAPVVRALAAHARGSVLLAEGDARTAVAALRDAASSWRVLEMPYEAACSRARAGLAYRELGDADGAEMELGAARATFIELGASPDLARLDDLAPPAGRPVARVLTDRECEVLRLVAAGKSNRAIAGDLVISEHTVGRHVQNIFTKLGLSSRAAATAYAYEHGLV